MTPVRSSPRTIIALGIVPILIVAATAAITGGASYPPGANASGVAPAVGAAHAEQAQELRSFTYSASTYDVGGQDVRPVEYELSADMADDEYLSVRTTAGGDVRVSKYVADGTVYERRVNDSGTFYDRYELRGDAAGPVLVLNRSLRTMARTGAFEYVERPVVGTQVGYRYVADDLRPVAVGVTPASNVTGEVVLGPDGLVRVLELRYSVETVGVDRRITERAELTGLDRTDVTRPGWVEEASEDA